jgi:hypothetical protein
MPTTYADYIVKAHAEFMLNVALIVGEELRELEAAIPDAATVDQWATLRFRGLNAAGKPLGLVVRLIPINEFRISADFIGHRGDSPSTPITDVRQWKTEELTPEELASVIVAYYRGEA